jgi:hypothetical protein
LLGVPPMCGKYLLLGRRMKQQRFLQTRSRARASGES